MKLTKQRLRKTIKEELEKKLVKENKDRALAVWSALGDLGSLTMPLKKTNSKRFEQLKAAHDLIKGFLDEIIA